MDYECRRGDSYRMGLDPYASPWYLALQERQQIESDDGLGGRI